MPFMYEPCPPIINSIRIHTPSNCLALAKPGNMLGRKQPMMQCEPFSLILKVILTGNAPAHPSTKNDTDLGKL